MNHVQAYNQSSQFRSDDLLIYEDSYKYPIKAFHRFLDGEPVTMDSIRDYFRELNASDLSASTIRVRRQAVKDRVRRKFAHADVTTKNHVETAFREMDRDPDLKCPGAQFNGIGDEKTITENEYIKVLEGCRSERQKLFIQFLFTTGARVSELCNISLADCKSEGKHIVVRLRGKGNARMSYKEREVYISNALYMRIRSEFAGDRYLFETSNGRTYARQYISEQIAKITLHVLGRRISAHKLRHSFATIKVKQHSLKAVSGYLGHSDISITAKYYVHDRLSPADVLGAEAVA